MQMNALRSANFLKLSSSNSGSELYCVGSMSAGTPAGYFLSQMRSMVLSLERLTWPLLVATGGARSISDSIGNEGDCGKRRDISRASGRGNSLSARGLERGDAGRHCEERSDEAIQLRAKRAKHK